MVMPKRVKSGPKKATKRQQEAIIRMAKELEEKPLLLVPEKGGHSLIYPWRGLGRRLKKIVDAKNDERRLSNFASRGDDVAKAFAATLLVKCEGKAPYLGSLATPYGNYKYAMRGKARPEHLVAVQNFHDPLLRLLAYRKKVNKWGGFLYSLKEKTVYTRKPDPEEYYHVWKNELPSPGPVPAPGPFALVKWESLGKTFEVNNRHKEKGSTYSSLTRYIVARSPWKDFSLKAGFHLEKTHGEITTFDIDVPENTFQAYFLGKITDDILLKRISEVYRQELGKMEERRFIIGSTDYGDDAGGFLERLNPTEAERKVLSRILQDVSKPVFIDEPKVSLALSRFPEKLKDGLKEILESEEKIDDILENHHDSPTDAIRIALDQARKSSIESRLPDLPNLQENGRFIDAVIRKARSGNKSEALRIAEKEVPGTAKGKTISCGIIKTLSQGSSKDWLFSKLELETGEYLVPYFQKLLEAEGDEYKETLSEVLVRSGSGESVED